MMATLTQMAASSALDSSTANASVLRHRPSHEPNANANSISNTSRDRDRERTRDTKYRHVFATHSLTRTSCLSHDADKTPSFVGFRNLMILVLSKHSSLPLQPHWANRSSRLQLAVDDCEPAKVWRAHMSQLPRLPPLRCHYRSAPLPPGSRPSVRHLPD